MACSCSKKAKSKYVWTGRNPDGTELTVVYDTEMQAKAKVLRKGGSYKTVPI